MKAQREAVEEVRGLVVTRLHSPLVNSGSGSFLKKDLSKLLTTLRSCHFCQQKETQRGVSGLRMKPAH